MTSHPSVVRVVFTDTNILINLLHLGRLDLLGALRGFEFIVPEPVANELVLPEQADGLQRAALDGHVAIEPLTDLGELEQFAELRLVMGDGEAACLAMAVRRGAIVATSDRKPKFLREARRLLGEGRLMNLTGLLVLAIRQGAITLEDADGYKAVLERNRYRLNFRSFRDVLGEPHEDKE